MRTMEELRVYLAETFRERLANSGYFSSVSILAEDSSVSTDFTMVGAFTQATIGTNGFSLFDILTQKVFDKPSAVRIVGGILKGGDAEPVTTFQCALACCIPRIVNGTNVTAPHSGISKSERSIAEIAKELEIVYKQKGISKARADSK